RQVNRIAHLVEDMLDIARINSGRLRIQKEVFDICNLVREVLDRHIPQFEAAGCEVHLKTCEQLEGSWDRFRMEQVINNLLINAMKYGAGTPVEIRLWRK